MKTQNIVVIDDSPAILLIMRSMMAELGFDNIVTSSCPKTALAHIRKSPQRYSAVFTDLNMPEIDGMSVIKELGQIGFQGGVCIISEMDTRVIELASEIARKHKINLIGNIPKPIPINELQRVLFKLSRITERHAPAEQALTKQELLECIQDGLIEPYYQPKVKLLSRSVEGIEVLARIVKPGKSNAILPGQFIPTAIECGLLNDVTRIVLKQVVADTPKLIAEFGKNVKISLNLSPSQLSEKGYPKEFMQAIDHENLDRENFTLEITEEFALEDTEQLESINRFRMQGFGLSLDDFGTGFTNLNQLRSLPFTEVKIDRTLISDIHRDPFNQVVVDTLVNIAKRLDISLIAEGTEEFSDLEYLGRKYDDMKVQGYLICKPKPLSSLLLWHHSWAHNNTP
ncbi:EAL domain-containing response regulator [Vibrio sp. SCSIO 43136]|uniref:EAL domain-containing response regulator n=1 Tax=Vibrio sp. SCSIO 43136 TaxID=2819101 RepID=UPI002075E043|nr:EAL domain-containing response regulator [Vibrio sp. SCSIO 43136]USD67853.1 EAL domain-containing response regulator [Vibrio sp. SCSIO 43136]